MSKSSPISIGLQALAAYLANKRPEILLEWHRRVDQDPELTTAFSISRTQFYDHIPQVLDAFERRLRANNADARDEAIAEQKQSAGEHGLHRWQQGYNQFETMREWSHLHLTLLEMLERCASEQPVVEANVMPIATRALARLCGDGVCESATRYARLQKLEAAARVRDLQQALDHLQTLDRSRAERWREAAHDLRSSVNTVTTAAAVLNHQGIPDTARAEMSHALQRGVIALRELLEEMMDLARLEAGEERRNVTEFDAAQLLKAFCDPFSAIAFERNLFFRTQGVDHLPVQGDASKIKRIAQNLVVNALKATTRGGVVVIWEERTTGDVQQWILCVQDTGPGLTLGTAAPLERALKRATEESQHVEEQVGAVDDQETKLEPAPTLPSRSSHDTSHASGGEGIGLSIVKRLCELLDASLELETSVGAGTTFRVIFPRRYAT
jgi:signal transduction histidine kinase